MFTLGDTFIILSQLSSGEYTVNKKLKMFDYFFNDAFELFNYIKHDVFVGNIKLLFAYEINLETK